MKKITKYIYKTKIKNKEYWLNLNNSAIIELDNDTLKKIKEYKKTQDKTIFSEFEYNTLCELEFLVDENHDENVKSVNELTYNISKYNNKKDRIKIDFALTNKCNFCCPYCFEKEELNKCIDNQNSKLKETAVKLMNYIDIMLDCGIKDLEVVFYGGEPTLEKEFIIDFIQNIKEKCLNKQANFSYVFVTNGFLFDIEFIKKLNRDDCKFIQITLDGEKDFHNSRRTNVNKINTFDILIRNINSLLEMKFKTVIRLNVDKTNFISVKCLLNNIDKLCNYNKDANYLSVDIARVFGSEDSYDLYEYEDVRKELVDIAFDKHLMQTRMGAKPLTTFCIAESLSNDLVIDNFGNLYRCWNNVFNNEYKIGTIDDLLKRECDPFETSNKTLEFVQKYSLSNVNNRKCFDCEFCKYCQGLCPNVRKLILDGEERNIYKNNECKKIIKKRLKQMIERGNIND